MVKWHNIGLVAFISLICFTPLAHSQCGDEAPVRLTLTSSEFEIPGYDASQGLLAVRPTRHLMPTKIRKRSFKLVMKARDILMPVGPDSLRPGLERSTLLELHLEGEPAKSVNGVGLKPDCGRLIVKKATLRHDGMLLAQRNIGERSSSRTVVSSTIQIERGRASEEKLRAIAASLAEKCLNRPALRRHQIQGALSIQLETTVLGQKSRPKVVVDGLVNPQVSACLLLSLHEDAEVWLATEPATRLYLNYFFRANQSVPSKP